MAVHAVRSDRALQAAVEVVEVARSVASTSQTAVVPEYPRHHTPGTESPPPASAQSRTLAAREALTEYGAVASAHVMARPVPTVAAVTVAPSERAIQMAWPLTMAATESAPRTKLPKALAVHAARAKLVAAGAVEKRIKTTCGMYLVRSDMTALRGKLANRMSIHNHKLKIKTAM